MWNEVLEIRVPYLKYDFAPSHWNAMGLPTVDVDLVQTTELFFIDGEWDKLKHFTIIEQNKIILWQLPIKGTIYVEFLSCGIS